jgi:hypothetical protein
MLSTQMEDYTEACGVVAFEGSVVLTGPGPISGAFTADAAEQSGLLLIEAAMRARLWSKPAVALSS